MATNGAEALAAKIRHELLGEELARYEREHGPIDPAAIDAAEAEMFGEAHRGAVA